MENNNLIRFSLSPEAKAAGCTFETPRVGDAGYDIRASEAVTLWNGVQVTVPTGLVLAIPDGYVGLIQDRSSLAIRRIRTHAGVIDPGFRGELSIVLENDNIDHYHVEAGDKIAQLVIVSVAQLPLVEHDGLGNEETARGRGAFGSTGKR